MRTASDNIYVLLLIATAAVLLLAILPVLLYVLFRNRALRQEFQMQQMALDHQRELLQASVRSQEKERQHIGAELHDHIINSMMLMNLKIRKADMPAALEQSERIAGQIRQISHGLSPVALRLFGLKEAVTELVIEWQEASGLQVEWHMSERKSLSELPYETGLHLYRILQELVNNTSRHAQASLVIVHLDCDPERLSLRYSDNGIGFDYANRQNRHNGMYNIESRLMLLNASSTVKSTPGEGFSFEASIPIVQSM